MKSFRFLLMAGLIALGFGACSDEVDVPKGGEELSGDVYMSFDLKLPTSRSTTDENDGQTNSNANPDYEVGLDKENKVASVKVVLATATTANNVTSYTYVAESKDDYKLVGNDETYTVTFEANELSNILPSEGESAPAVYAFVVCNPPTGFKASEIFSGNGKVTTGDETLISSIAKNDAFLMTNAEISKVSNIPTNLTSFNSPSNPFDLGSVKVERTAARFDYKAVKTDNIYPIEDTNVSIQLTGMTLVNMSNNYWWLRRVAPSVKDANKYDSDKIALCGVETPNNYVVDTDAEQKLNGSVTAANFSYSVGLNNEEPIDPTDFTYDALPSTTEDKWTGADGYYIWRYATENTLPSIDKQVKKYSTGVIFKGEITETVAEGGEALLNGNAVYVFGDVLYGDWNKLTAAATETDGKNGPLKNVSLNAAYEQAKATISGEGVTEPTLENAAKAGFTVYKPTTTEDGKNKYNVYYYYWNRHNDNNDNTKMGIMEFAVVRNNVYKLSVESIKRFGHPSNPGGDPDPELPDDPDEDNKVYFRVGVQVLPWVVRVNNIEF